MRFDNLPFDFLQHQILIVVTLLGGLQGVGQHAVPLLQQLQRLQLQLDVLLDHHSLEDLEIIRSPHLLRGNREHNQLQVLLT